MYFVKLTWIQCGEGWSIHILLNNSKLAPVILAKTQTQEEEMQFD